MGPKNVHIRIPEPMNITLCMALLQIDVIKVKDPDMGEISLCYAGGSSPITRALKRKKTFPGCREQDKRCC